MANLGPDVKQAIEDNLGVKVDGVVSVADVVAVVKVIIKVAKMPDVKEFIGQALDAFMERVKATPSKIDDILVGNVVAILKRVLGIVK